MKLAYLKCLCGKNASLADTLITEGYTIKLINNHRANRLEALEYKTKLPFKVTNGVVEKL